MHPMSNFSSVRSSIDLILVWCEVVMCVYVFLESALQEMCLWMLFKGSNLFQTYRSWLILLVIDDHEWWFIIMHNWLSWGSIDDDCFYCDEHDWIMIINSDAGHGWGLIDGYHQDDENWSWWQCLDDHDNHDHMIDWWFWLIMINHEWWGWMDWWLMVIMIDDRGW